MYLNQYAIEGEPWKDNERMRLLIGKAQTCRTSAARKKAVHEIAMSNIGLVTSVAERYREVATHHTFEDLVQVGFEGMMKAIERFDLDRTHKGRPIRFSTYAVWWINQAIRRYVLDSDHPIHTPEYMLNAISKSKRELSPDDWTPERVSEFSKKSVIGIKNIRAALVARSVLELDKPVSNSKTDPFGESRTKTLGDMVKDPGADEAFERAEFLADNQPILRVALAAMNERERMVVLLRSQDKSITLEQIGHKLGVTREAVRRIESRAKQKARDAVSRAGLSLDS